MKNYQDIFIYISVAGLFVTFALIIYTTRDIFRRSRFDKDFQLKNEKGHLYKIAFSLLLFGLCSGITSILVSYSGSSSAINDLTVTEIAGLAYLQVLLCTISVFVIMGLIILNRIRINMYYNKKDHETKLQAN